jgi:hypothetical protein
MELKVADLETLHNNIPSIQDLNLHDFMIWNSSIPQVVMPTTSFKTLSLSIKMCDRNTSLIDLYQYMTKKYIHVTHWNHSPKIWLYSRVNIKKVFENGYLPFLQLIGPTQDELVFYFLQNGNDVFKVLDESGSQIKKFSFRKCQQETLFQDLAQSNQAKYVKSLSLYETAIGSLDILGSMISLTTLNISLRSESFHLTDCLNACPSTLRNFSFKHDHVVLDRSTTHESFIENLTITSRTLTKEFGETISFCFPKLVNLQIQGALLEDVILTPQSPHFQTAKVSPMPFEKEFVFSFTSANNPKPLLCLCGWNKSGFTGYKASKHLRKLFFDYSKEQVLDTSDPPCIKVRCC